MAWGFKLGAGGCHGWARRSSSAGSCSSRRSRRRIDDDERLLPVITSTHGDDSIQDVSRYPELAHRVEPIGCLGMGPVGR